MLSDETRKRYEHHKNHTGTHGGNDAAATLTLADAVLSSGKALVEAVEKLEALIQERNQMLKPQSDLDKFGV